MLSNAALVVKFGCMRLAWFHPLADPHLDDPTDDATLLMRALQSRHEIERIDARRAHDFVWKHARNPYDLCVYELDDTPAHQFIWAYAAHYPGVTRLRRLTPWRKVQAALLRSRMMVVAHAAVREMLADECPAAQVRAITPGVGPLAGPTDEIVMALEWPVDGAPLTRALAGFAAGRAVVVFDTLETADWPSLDPQSWQPRSPAASMCVAVDPRDEDHSRRLAVRRLTEDAALRNRLGTAAEEWWRANATVERAAAAFEQVLEEARNAQPPRTPERGPAPVADDGSRVAREILAAFGLELTFATSRAR
jgi:hypothetical protein